ncbi:MAG: glucose 1-dehydrogenase [Lentilactobacillus diolivorans]|jgi:NAD(P)-dependent dehydrogenase (short-subunit alcohol dehydrogenase family)|uniref:3-alpha-(Or 20-beta)-hydroxysteroid dehydrogenase n=2 Tax=Lentilactobacillus diolivorans TaxID=179838 RepID=A0A0R1S7Q3_9LACO|nr:glucose 1-dehydrogenase [Lentilactobacillus diolivorans]RRG02173.1 MAG: SDR family NAD(P)-dependent oxidoreductase [Lactobacillus sp.]KRL64928.1 3-alpha-(or 20-beta)-hydroxysteroid dehydrogenase [Lentilactobacillus diolivorans DSM 14421]MCH4164509.1 glucose 1-dehydrogenase [Lentilactobacillus diolivorans]MDH5105235.1 glucose 1-dehydrogenase [Lentilactobacillus diolivorans]GEP23679.1 2,5-dichloro-2,5-cyclohexadiene-1,4-diol dehydrogenase [Lentilactobacillus diolivorans]
MTDRLKGKVAIVTGGTLGIGLGIARRFVDEGAKVVITGRHADVGEKSAKEIGTPDQVRFVKCDATQEQSWVDLWDETEKLFGPVTTLVNNAGMAIGKSVENTTTEEWRKLLAVNLDAVFFGTRLGIQRMKNKGLGASIINMSSIEGFVGDPNLGAYNASKGAVRIMSKSAALDCALKDYDVRVNTVHPGYIKTPLVQDLDAEKEMSKRTKTPMGHIGEPDDIAWMCVYLASNESKFATGAEFVVDGGYLAQ